MSCRTHIARIRSAAIVLLLGASVGSAQPVWNIADHGAEQGLDVAEVINEGLRTQHEHGLPVYIPSGRWGIGSTIDLPKRQGGALIGAGGAGGGANDSLRGLDSVLEWYGDSDSPMLRMNGARWRVENLTVRGVPFKSDRKKAAIGILVTKNGRGIGTGKHEFRNLAIAECGVGFQCGLTPGEHNNDLLGFERLTLLNCGVGYQVINSQSMAHWIERLDARGTPTVFRFYGGGMLSVRDIAAFDSTLLDVRRNDPAKFSPGSNNAVFRFENLKVDAQHAGEFCLAEVEDGVSAHVFLNGAMISGPAPFTLARLGSSAELVARDLQSPTKGAVIERRPGAKVKLDNANVKGLIQP